MMKYKPSKIIITCERPGKNKIESNRDRTATVNILRNMSDLVNSRYLKLSRLRNYDKRRK